MPTVLLMQQRPRTDSDVTDVRSAKAQDGERRIRRRHHPPTVQSARGVPLLLTSCPQL